MHSRRGPSRRDYRVGSGCGGGEAADLHDRLRVLEAAAEASRRQTETLREELQKTRRETEREVSRARVQQDTARLEMALQIARDHVAVAAANAERDAAIAAANAQRDAAVAEANAQRDVAIARAAAIEGSVFWRLTKPVRRLLDASPALHRLVRAAIGSASRTAAGQPRCRLEGGAATVVPEASGTAVVCDPVSLSATLAEEVAHHPPGGGGLFNAAQVLKTVALPEDARKCLIVPFGGLPSSTTIPRIAVMVHAYYPEQLSIILRHLAEIPGPPDLFVTTDIESKRVEIQSQLVGWRAAQFEVRVFPNRGRDIAPKLYGLADVYAKYDLVLHLHTKRSPHTERGDDWFDHLLQTLVGSEPVVRSVLAAFAMQPKLGMVFAEHWQPVSDFVDWGYNYLIAQELALQMGFRLSRDEPLEFPSGSMFWARPAALAPLLALKLGPEDFPREAGQGDGTIAHAIERLFLRVCEHAGYSWARIAHAELFDGDVARAVQVPSTETLRNALRRHSVLFADPALRTSVRILSAQPETWPMRIAPEFDGRPRVNLLIPTLRAASASGGIATAHALFERIADAVGPEVERRIVITTEDQSLAPDDLPRGWSLVSPTDAGGDRSAVLLARGARFDHGLPVRSFDVFVASAWWDAAASFGLIELQRRFFGCGARLRYFIQDYEPSLSAWSASWALAEQTYCRPDDTVAIVDSGFLADYLDERGLRFAERHVFRPLWNEGLGAPDANSTDREDVLLVHWRPHIERNLGPIVASALAQWLEQNPYSAQRWRILGVGQDADDVRLTDWRSMTSLGKVTLSQYKTLLRRAKVGLCLMLSPHPSYPPLEMAAFGMRVITNSFGSKDLSRFGSGIESVRANAGVVAAALGRATEYWAADHASAPNFDFDGAFAVTTELDALATEIAKGIRCDVGLS